MNDIQETITEKEAARYAAALSRYPKIPATEVYAAIDYAAGWRDAMRYIVDYLRLTFDVPINDKEIPE